MNCPRRNELLVAFGTTRIDVGGTHCVALTGDGRIMTWGVNNNRALGRDTVSGRGRTMLVMTMMMIGEQGGE